jgi:hypothetical protein
MMEVARSSETLVNFYQTTRRYNPEDSHLRTNHSENLKSYFLFVVFQTVRRSNTVNMNSPPLVRFHPTALPPRKGTPGEHWTDRVSQSDSLQVAAQRNILVIKTITTFFTELSRIISISDPTENDAARWTRTSPARCNKMFEVSEGEYTFAF